MAQHVAPPRQAVLEQAAVACRRNVVLDLDLGGDNLPSVDMDRSKTLSALRDLKPSAVVSSGGGYHVWFPIEEVAGADALKSSADTLAEAMGAVYSDNMADAPRIIRLPGTINIPSPRKRERQRSLSWSRMAEQNDGAPTRSVDALARDLREVATRVGLPAHADRPRRPTKAASPSSTSPGTGVATAAVSDKAPSPAPNAEVLRLGDRPQLPLAMQPSMMWASVSQAPCADRQRRLLADPTSTRAGAANPGLRAAPANRPGRRSELCRVFVGVKATRKLHGAEPPVIRMSC